MRKAAPKPAAKSAPKASSGAKQRPASTPPTTTVTKGKKPSTSAATSKKRLTPPPQLDKQQPPLPAGTLGSTLTWMGVPWRVAYLGPVYHSGGRFLGLEQSNKADADMGNCNGNVEGTQYFTCEENRGLLLPLRELEGEIRAQRQCQGFTPDIAELESPQKVFDARHPVVAGVGSLLADRRTTSVSHTTPQQSTITASPSSLLQQQPPSSANPAPRRDSELALDEQQTTKHPSTSSAPLPGAGGPPSAPGLRESTDSIGGWAPSPGRGGAGDDDDVCVVVGAMALRGRGALGGGSGLLLEDEVPREGICTGLAPDKQSPMQQGCSPSQQVGHQHRPPVSTSEFACQAGTSYCGGSSPLVDSGINTDTFAPLFYDSSQQASAAQAAVEEEQMVACLGQESTPVPEEEEAMETLRRCSNTLLQCDALFSSLQRSVKEACDRLDPLQKQLLSAAETTSSLLATWHPPSSDAVLATPVSDQEAAHIASYMSFLTNSLEQCKGQLQERYERRNLNPKREKEDPPASTLSSSRHQEHIEMLQQRLNSFRQNNNSTESEEIHRTSSTAVGSFFFKKTEECLGIGAKTVDILLRPLVNQMQSHCPCFSGKQELPELTSFWKEINFKCEQVKRLMFDAREFLSRIADEGAEGNVEQCEVLSYKRLDVLQEAQRILTEDVLPLYPGMMTKLLDEPRTVFNKMMDTCRTELKSLEGEATAQWRQHVDRIEDDIEQRIKAEEDLFVRNGYDIGTRYATAKREFDEAMATQQQQLEIIHDATRRYYEANETAKNAFAALKRESYTKLALLSNQRDVVRAQIIDAESVKNVSHCAHALVMLLRMLGNAWIPGVEESEGAAVMELQRRFTESRNAVHDLHTQLYRDIHLAAGELVWKKEQSLLAICDKIHTKEVEMEIAAETLDPSSKELAQVRDGLATLKHSLEADVNQLNTVAQQTAIGFREHSGKLLTASGHKVPDVEAEVQEANQQRQKRIDAMNNERMRAIKDKEKNDV